jgi:hypothetical protein
MYIRVCYIRHLAISFIATVWVSQALVRNGRTFLIDSPFTAMSSWPIWVNHLCWSASISSVWDTVLGPAHQRPTHDGAAR